MTESDNIVAETAARIFADLADPQTINRAADGAWKKPLWDTLAEAGLTLAWVPEGQGGAGAGLADGFYDDEGGMLTAVWAFRACCARSSWWTCFKD